jgi:dipeptidyl-peptidase-4
VYCAPLSSLPSSVFAASVEEASGPLTSLVESLDAAGRDVAADLTAWGKGLSAWGMEKLSHSVGVHTCVAAVTPDGVAWVADTTSNEMQRPCVRLHAVTAEGWTEVPVETLGLSSPTTVATGMDARALRAELLAWVEQGAETPVLPVIASPVAPVFVSIPCSDAISGEFSLLCAAFLPDASVHGPPPYPTVVSVYGGPHV